MIEKEAMEAYLEGILKDTGIFLVDVRTEKSNKIHVYVDRHEGISIEECVMISRAIEEKLDRDKEDFALEVSSPGLDSPFKVAQQYEKNIGRMVSVNLKDGKKILGVLMDAGSDHLLLQIASGKKGEDPEPVKVGLDEILATKAYIQF